MFITKDRSYAYQLLTSQTGFLVKNKERILHKCRNNEVKIKIQHAIDTLDLITTNFKISYLLYLNHSILHQQLDKVFLAYSKVRELVDSAAEFDSKNEIMFHLRQVSDFLCLIAYQQCSEDFESNSLYNFQDSLILV